MELLNRIFCAVFLTLTSSLNMMGQSYTFHHLKTDNGLSSSNVKSILKDSYGFLWIGTESGLNRYDGYGFKVYTAKSDKPSSIANDDIWGLQEDGMGNIWINSGFSYTVYHRDKDSFISDIPHLLKELGIQVDYNYKVYVDKVKDLWVLSQNKVFFYDTRKKTLKVFVTKEKIDETATTDLSDDGDHLYRVLKSGFIWKINKYSGKESLIELPGFIIKVMINRDSRIYVDTQNGLWLFSSNTNILYYKKNGDTEWEKLSLNSFVNTQSDIVLDIIDDENGHIWIGTDHKALFIYTIANGSITNIIHDQNSNASIASNNVGCLYRDNDGVIWIGHSKKGISYYHDSFNNIINIEQRDCKDINTILEDKNGNVWLGTDGNGLYLMDQLYGSKVRKLPMQNNAIVSLLEDKKGRIWIGTYLNGLFCYEKGKFNHFTRENSTLASNNIWNLKEDRYGNLWIGTMGGGIQCRRRDKKSFDSIITTVQGLECVLDMYYDNGDKLYIGTVNGLCIIDIITGKQVMIKGNISGTQKFKQMFISIVYKDERGNIWLGHSNGLTLWDLKKDTLYYFDKKGGLCDNIIRGIVEDNHQHIWVTASNGLSVLSAESDLQGFMKISSRNFSTKDGLKDNYFNNHSICKLRNGDILLGGTEGYAVINPNKMAEKSKPLAKIIFTELSLGNTTVQVDSLYNGHKLLDHPIEQTSSITISYDDKLIAIQFTTGDLINADKVKYLYQLEGFNNQWLPAQENKIEFSSLAPGAYRLMIKASNSDGTWNDEVTALDIKVTPPVYLSSWAIISYIIAIISLAVYIVHRTKKKQRTELEQQAIQLKHQQEVNLNEMKLRFFTNISHDLRTPLTLITIPLQTILNKELEDGLRTKLNIVYRNAEQLMTLINSLLDFRKLDVGTENIDLKLDNFVHFIKEKCTFFQAYATDRNMKFSFTSEMETLLMHFDPVKIQKILFNILFNAFKYTPNGGSINLHIYREEENVCVSVSDTGQGINDREKKRVFERFYQASQDKENTGSGIGLHIVSEYLSLHGGTVTVMDNIPQGSVFTFKLPIREINTKQKEENSFGEDTFENTKDQGPRMSPVILFVDDNKDFCEFMSGSLSEEYIVLVANNGKEAIERLENNDVNLVVSDVMMPLMSGTELCSQIKNNIHWSHIPVILLTARTAEEYKIEGLELGADDYLTKPFNFNLLKLRIRKFLDWTEKCHHLFSKKIDISPSEITITSLDEQLIEKAIKTVEKNISDPDFTVEELGSAVCLSRSHLYKKLMYITGKGPSEFIRTLRLKRGKQLLEKSQLQIAEIAYAVGFNSPKRFTVNFKNEFGISPSEYLRSLKKDA